MGWIFSRSASEAAWSFALPRPDFVAGSYEGRTFLNPSNHLGEDSRHVHHDTVHAIADGVVREAGDATGYGHVVVVEHLLPDGSRVCSIYGHLCGHWGYPLIRSGSQVKKGDVVGYIGDRFENGDGMEHLHLGLRKGRYDGYFCGYARKPHCTPKKYHPPTAFIQARSGEMRLVSKIESFPMNPAFGFKAIVKNGFFYGGTFQLRLRLLAGNSEIFTSEAQNLVLLPGASASLLFTAPSTGAKSPRAEIELLAPGTASWCRVSRLD
jgi:Peptidase family M23